MAYTALYRKWRSQTFDEVKGQKAITESFKNQIKAGRIGHAYLFCGTRGTGKTSVAKILARAVNCEHPVNGNPCNECASCRSILKDSNMNVIEMDAASNNGVDDIRDIRDKVQYPPVDAKYKVYIIDEVHMLSQAAFNAFLKTLEEPPEYVIFILATTEPNKLPVTILSRCQRYDFKRIESSVIAERLREIASEEKIDVTEEALHYIARVGDGSMRDSVSLFDQCAQYCFDRSIDYEAALEILGAVDTSVFSDIFRAIAAHRVEEILRLVEEIMEQGRELGQFLSDFLLYLRNLLLAKNVENLKNLVDLSRENMQRLQEDKERLSQEELLRGIRLLSECQNQLRFAHQRRVLLEVALMKFAYPETDVTKEGVGARLAELERELEELRKNGTVPFGEERTKRSSASAMGGAEEKRISEREADKARVVTLPRAEYEDFMRIQKNWSSFVQKISDDPLRSALQGSMIQNNGNGILKIVTTSSIHKGLIEDTLGGRPKLQIIKELLEKQFQRSVQLQVEYQDLNDSRRFTSYVSDQDLQSKIDFAVESVDELEGLDDF